MNISSLQSRCFFLFLPLLIGTLSLHDAAWAQQRRRPAGGRSAVVVDERLSVLRDTPGFAGKLLRRIGRGKWVAVKRAKRTADGLVFYQVNVTRRTGGWLQRESVVMPSQAGEDSRLVRLINGSDDFDRIARARIFLDLFSHSALRPAVLLLYGDEAEKAADKLAHDAIHRLSGPELEDTGAPLVSYYQNFNGIDRYRRQGINFGFDMSRKQFRYDGAAWRELIRRYPLSTEAEQARQRLEKLSASTNH